MIEVQFIAMLSQLHGSRPFMADAEQIPLPDGRIQLLSMDSFNEKEDFFSGLSPYQIGHQMAAAACSDLLACGAMPSHLLQTWTVDSSHAQSFYEEAAKGIQDVLSFYGASCIGGDIGTADAWSWTATVIGFSQQPVLRQTAKRIPFDLFASGPFGEANAAVCCRRLLPSFPLNQPVPADALFATDSSGGFFDAIENFRRVNHGLHMTLRLDEALSPRVNAMLSEPVNPAWSLVGGIGEYELLFALPHGQAAPPHAINIGSGFFSDEDDNDIQMVYHGRHGRMTTPPPDYRLLSEDNWLTATRQFWDQLFL